MYEKMAVGARGDYKNSGSGDIDTVWYRLAKTFIY